MTDTTGKGSATTQLHTRSARSDADGERVSLLIYHRDGTRTVALREGAPVVLGRDVPSDVVLQESSLSRRHARFGLDDGRVWVEDLDSTNGTWMGGERVRRADAAPGVEVSLGAVSVTVHRMASQEASELGMLGHDRFLAELESEVTRARFFERTLAVVMIRNGVDRTSCAAWFPTIARALRAVDSARIYSRDTVEILMPELDADGAEARIQRAVSGSPSLRAGVASFPESATSAGSLLDQAREGLKLSDPETPVAVARASRGSIVAGANTPQSHAVVACAAMEGVYRTVNRLARTMIPVLISGETGAGKEVVARAIHENGPRAAAPMRSVNCGAIPGQLLESTLFGHVKGAFTGAAADAKGVFESAKGGTVFLDEIGELPPQAQVALLRVLEAKHITRVGSTQEIDVDARIIAATHRDLEAMCETGEFRWDLYYRLNVMSLRVPPLREREEEVPALAERFLALANETNSCRIQGIRDGAMAALTGYDWPGNVRELRNAIERAVVIADGTHVAVEDLPERVRAGAGLPSPQTPGPETRAPTTGLDPRISTSGIDFKEHIQQYEANLILAALDKCDGNQAAAAAHLRIPDRTLRHKMKTYGIKRGTHRVD